MLGFVLAVPMRIRIGISSVCNCLVRHMSGRIFCVFLSPTAEAEYDPSLSGGKMRSPFSL